VVIGIFLKAGKDDQAFLFADFVDVAVAGGGL